MPQLHYFNPGHETAVLNGSSYYMPPATISLMQTELAFLPAWYAATDDFILTKEIISPNFLQQLTKWWGSFPTPLTYQEIIEKGIFLPPAIASPWGISPKAYKATIN